MSKHSEAAHHLLTVLQFRQESQGKTVCQPFSDTQKINGGTQTVLALQQFITLKKDTHIETGPLCIVMSNEYILLKLFLKICTIFYAPDY